ncbi:MAG: PEP-CTERM sorting domain-containing protein [Cyanobacteriota bacterium]|nr:PEP-CTERM sorting domain-containing protein [Cyanobacteriota bacterium]
MIRAKFAIAATAALMGLGIATQSASASTFYINFEREEFGGTLSGRYLIDSSSFDDDGFIDENEVIRWMVEWSGNSDVDAFSLSSDDGDRLKKFLSGEDTFIFAVDDPNDDDIFVLYDNNVSSTEFLMINDALTGDGEFCTTACTGSWKYSSVLDATATAPTAPVPSTPDVATTPEPTALLGFLALGGLTAVSGLQRKKR